MPHDSETFVCSILYVPLQALLQSIVELVPVVVAKKSLGIHLRLVAQRCLTYARLALALLNELRDSFPSGPGPEFQIPKPTTSMQASCNQLLLHLRQLPCWTSPGLSDAENGSATDELSQLSQEQQSSLQQAFESAKDYLKEYLQMLEDLRPAWGTSTKPLDQLSWEERSKSQHQQVPPLQHADVRNAFEGYKWMSGIRVVQNIEEPQVASAISISMRSSQYQQQPGCLHHAKDFSPDQLQKFLELLMALDTLQHDQDLHLKQSLQNAEQQQQQQLQDQQNHQAVARICRSLLPAALSCGFLRAAAGPKGVCSLGATKRKTFSIKCYSSTVAEALPGQLSVDCAREMASPAADATATPLAGNFPSGICKVPRKSVGFEPDQPQYTPQQHQQQELLGGAYGSSSNGGHATRLQRIEAVCLSPPAVKTSSEGPAAVALEGLLPQLQQLPKDVAWRCRMKWLVEVAEAMELLHRYHVVHGSISSGKPIWFLTVSNAVEYLAQVPIALSKATTCIGFTTKHVSLCWVN